MNHDEITELLGAYALDAVDDDERDEVERHLADCARCRAEVQEHREVAALLAHSGADAPDGVWDRIASALDAGAPGPLRSPAPASPAAPSAPSSASAAPPPAPATVVPLRARAVPRLAVAALAAAAVVVAALGFQVRDQGQRIDELQVALEDPLVPAYEAALGSPGATPVELVSDDGTIVVEGVVAPDGTGFLQGGRLPRLDAGRTYQLWGADGTELVSLGVLGANPEVVSFRGAGYDAFAITEEEAGGVVTSRNLPVVAGAV